MKRSPVIVLTSVFALLAAGCAARVSRPYPPSPTTAAAAPKRLFVYPAKGQSQERTARDRYECYRWAVRETGYDPSAAVSNIPPVVAVAPARPARPGLAGPVVGAAAGAAAGAAIGAIAGDPGMGAAIGATSGAVLGTAKEVADAQQENQAQIEEARVQAAVFARDQSDTQILASNYSRALSACLEARGYSVQ